MLKHIGSFVVGVAVLGGCGIDSSQLPDEGALATQTAELRRSDDGIIVANGLSTVDLLANALTTNRNRVKRLRTLSLTDAFSTQYMREGVYGDAGRNALTYLVQCALPAGVPFVVDGQTYRGAYGVCPSWATTAPDSTCLELVTSCMLARNNPTGHHERISLRGEPMVADSARYVAQPTVRPESWDVTRAPITSLGACAPGAASGTSRNCGWKTLDLQACAAGTRVVVGFGGKDPNACSNPRTYGSQTPEMDMMIRVCSGDQPCDSTGSLAQSDYTCASIRPAVNVLCPASGRLTVMTAPFRGDGTMSGSPVFGGSASVHPMSEVEAFPVREGVFFGNMFDESKLGANVEWDVQNKKPVVTWFVATGGPIYGNTYSCADDGWVNRLDYHTTRICAASHGSSMRCISNRLGACSSVCAINDGPALIGDYDYESCRDSLNRPWNNSLTSFLVDACDLVPASGPTQTPPAALCKRAP